MSSNVAIDAGFVKVRTDVDPTAATRSARAREEFGGNMTPATYAALHGVSLATARERLAGPPVGAQAEPQAASKADPVAAPSEPAPAPQPEPTTLEALIRHHWNRLRDPVKAARAAADDDLLYELDGAIPQLVERGLLAMLFQLVPEAVRSAVGFDRSAERLAASVAAQVDIKAADVDRAPLPASAIVGRSKTHLSRPAQDATKAANRMTSFVTARVGPYGWPMPAGGNLGDATADELDSAAKVHRNASGSHMKTALVFEKLAARLRSGNAKRVRDAIPESEVRDMLRGGVYD